MYAGRPERPRPRGQRIDRWQAGVGGGSRGKEGRWAWGTFWGDENVLKPDSGVAV